jgi:c-di-GMP-binding flagellar brake protein YcgR
MAEDTLNLMVGSTVQLQLTVPEDSPRELVRVIGYLPGASLVVSSPMSRGNVKIVREGQIYKVRMLQGDTIVAFEARVLAVALKPYPHLHLQYPREFEQIVVRNSARVVAHLPCQVRNTGRPDSPEHFHTAEMMDLSETGAKLGAPVSLGEVGEMVQINFALDVLGQQEALVLVADIRSRSERLEKRTDKRALVHCHGVEFKAVNRFQQVLLHGWVMEQLVNGGGEV